jgi:hypothetical protein
MGRPVEYTLLPPAGRVLYASISGAVVLTALVVVGVVATIPSVTDVVAIGSDAGIPSLVRPGRFQVRSLARPVDAGHLRSVFEALDYDLDKVRSFLNLMGAVRSYMHNLNSHAAYAAFRAARARARAAGQTVEGHALTGTLVGYSERGEAYVDRLRALIRVNGLAALGRARLSNATED